MNPSEAPTNTMTSRVHWNDDSKEISGRINSGRLNQSVAARDACDNAINRRQEDLKTKINKAVQIELAYLDKALEVGKKRKKLMRVLKETAEEHEQTTKGSDAPSEESIHLRKKLKEKIAYAIKMEEAYLNKARQTHDRRYRWTKLYEVSKKDNKTDRSELPPLMPSRLLASFGTMNTT